MLKDQGSMIFLIIFFLVKYFYIAVLQDENFFREKNFGRKLSTKNNKTIVSFFLVLIIPQNDKIIVQQLSFLRKCAERFFMTVDTTFKKEEVDFS